MPGTEHSDRPIEAPRGQTRAAHPGYEAERYPDGVPAGTDAVPPSTPLTGPDSDQKPPARKPAGVDDQVDTWMHRGSTPRRHRTGADRLDTSRPSDGTTRGRLADDGTSPFQRSRGRTQSDAPSGAARTSRRTGDAAAPSSPQSIFDLFDPPPGANFGYIPIIADGGEVDIDRAASPPSTSDSGPRQPILGGDAGRSGRPAATGSRTRGAEGDKPDGGFDWGSVPRPATPQQRAAANPGNAGTTATGPNQNGRDLSDVPSRILTRGGRPITVRRVTDDTDPADLDAASGGSGGVSIDTSLPKIIPLRGDNDGGGQSRKKGSQDTGTAKRFASGIAENVRTLKLIDAQIAKRTGDVIFRNRWMVGTHNKWKDYQSDNPKKAAAIKIASGLLLATSMKYMVSGDMPFHIDPHAPKWSDFKPHWPGHGNNQDRTTSTSEHHSTSTTLGSETLDSSTAKTTTPGSTGSSATSAASTTTPSGATTNPTSTTAGPTTSNTLGSTTVDSTPPYQPPAAGWQEHSNATTDPNFWKPHDSPASGSGGAPVAPTVTGAEHSAVTGGSGVSLAEVDHSAVNSSGNQFDLSTLNPNDKNYTRVEDVWQNFFHHPDGSRLTDAEASRVHQVLIHRYPEWFESHTGKGQLFYTREGGDVGLNHATHGFEVPEQMANDIKALASDKNLLDKEYHNVLGIDTHAADAVAGSGTGTGAGGTGSGTGAEHAATAASESTDPRTVTIGSIDIPAPGAKDGSNIFGTSVNQDTIINLIDHDYKGDRDIAAYAWVKTANDSRFHDEMIQHLTNRDLVVDSNGNLTAPNGVGFLSGDFRNSLANNILEGNKLVEEGKAVRIGASPEEVAGSLGIDLRDGPTRTAWRNFLSDHGNDAYDIIYDNKNSVSKRGWRFISKAAVDAINNSWSEFRERWEETKKAA